MVVFRTQQCWRHNLTGLLVWLFCIAPIAAGQAEPESPDRVLMRTQLPGYISVVQGGRAYRKGFPTAAAEQWKLAAKWGHKQAQLMLGLLHVEGDGVEKSWSTAHAWLTLASSRGDQLAIENKNSLWNAMTDSEKRLAAKEFAALQAAYGDAVVLDRLATWYRKERHRSRGLRPQLVIIPGTTNNLQVVDFDERLGNLFFGEFFPAYDIQYRDLQVIEDPPDDHDR